MLRILGHILAVAALTLATQLGGLAWLIGLWLRRPVLGTLGAYALLWLLATQLAPLTGRIPLPCGDGAPIRVAHWSLCAMNRHYVVPDLAEALTRAADRYHATTGAGPVLALDGSFPFLTGFPLLPHLSHDDGEKVDLALIYQPADQLRSPIGYFAFEDGPTHCPPAWPTLRWDLHWMQGVWRDLPLDEARTQALVRALLAEPRIAKILIEPHLKDRLGLSDPRLRFQGCRAARHDDHLHLQL